MPDYLSGGERTKKHLNKLFLASYDLLILDEPTNHLDQKGVNWLIKQIDGYKGAIIVISHDRYCLDQTVHRIVEIENNKLIEYDGNYSDYKRQKAHARLSHQNAWAIQQKEQADINTEIKRLKQWSSKGHRTSTKKQDITGTKFGSKEHFRKKVKKKDKQIKSKIKRLEKLTSDGVSKPDDQVNIWFDFGDSSSKQKKVLSVEHVSKCFDQRVLFEDAHFYIFKNERVSLVGNNGSGKTTLINMIRGLDNDYQGQIHFNGGQNVAYLSQDILDMDNQQTVEQILNLSTKTMITNARQVLANLALPKDIMTRLVGRLSMGGERTRVKIGSLILNEVDILILDEPTNHLDILTKETLQEALSHFKGTLLLCSHDRYLRDTICDTFIEIKDGRVRKYQQEDIDAAPPDGQKLKEELQLFIHHHQQHL